MAQVNGGTIRTFQRTFGVWLLSVSEICDPRYTLRFITAMSTHYPQAILIRVYAEPGEAGKTKGDVRIMNAGETHFAGAHVQFFQILIPGDDLGNYPQLFALEPMPASPSIVGHLPGLDATDPPGELTQDEEKALRDLLSGLDID